MLSCILNGNDFYTFDTNYSKEEKKKWANKNLLICPVCKKPYEYCHGLVKQPYFRHKDKTECESFYSESETNEHLLGKQILYEWIKKQNGVTDVILEGYIEGTKQRPDILFKYKDKIYVIEYQCSPISTEYYERHDLYKAAGITDIWICGFEKYLTSNDGRGKRLKTIGKESMLYFDPVNKLFYKSLEHTSYYYGLTKHKMNISYKINNFILDMKDAEFIDGVVDLNNRTKEKLDQRKESIDNIKDSRKRIMEIKKMAINNFLRDFCYKEGYVFDSYTEGCFYKESNNKKCIQLSPYTNQMYIVSKIFYREKYEHWNGKKNVIKEKWKCDINSDPIPNSKYKKLEYDFVKEIAEKYLGD